MEWQYGYSLRCEVIELEQDGQVSNLEELLGKSWWIEAEGATHARWKDRKGKASEVGTVRTVEQLDVTWNLGLGTDGHEGSEHTLVAKSPLVGHELTWDGESWSADEESEIEERWLEGLGFGGGPFDSLKTEAKTPRSLEAEEWSAWFRPLGRPFLQPDAAGEDDGEMVWLLSWTADPITPFEGDGHLGRVTSEERGLVSVEGSYELAADLVTEAAMEWLRALDWKDEFEEIVEGVTATSTFDFQGEVDSLSASLTGEGKVVVELDLGEMVARLYFEGTFEQSLEAKQ